MQPIRRHKLYEAVADRIEAMILSGEYRDGEKLPSERALMAYFGVGRPAVREALFALQKMGLLAISNGERARVTRPTPEILMRELGGTARHLLAQPEGVRHFQQSRALFETALARQAAEQASDADIAALAAALAANQQAIGDPVGFARTDAAFHAVLAASMRNPVVTALHDALAGWMQEQQLAVVRLRGAARASYRAHGRIYAAIAARDAAGAAQAMGDHWAEISRYQSQLVG